MISHSKIKPGKGVCVDKTCYDIKHLATWLNSKPEIPHNRKPFTKAQLFDCTFRSIFEEYRRTTENLEINAEDVDMPSTTELPAYNHVDPDMWADTGWVTIKGAS